jgi:hypothetical protein
MAMRNSLDRSLRRRMLDAIPMDDPARADKDLKDVECLCRGDNWAAKTLCFAKYSESRCW